MEIVKTFNKIVDNKKIEKQIKAALSGISMVLFTLAIFIFIGYTLKASNSGIGLGEATGTLLEVIMGFEILLWFGVKSIKLLKNEPRTKKLEITITKVLQKFHKPVGVLGISALLLHFSMVFNIKNPFDFQQITGYTTAFFVLMTILFAILKGKYKKKFRFIHILCAFLAVVPFLFHG